MDTFVETWGAHLKLTLRLWIVTATIASPGRVSYVKDYDGGTHMECYVHPTIPYLSQAEMFAKQREWLVQRIAETSSSTRVLPGLPKSVFHDGGRVRHIDIPGESFNCSARPEA